MADRLQQRAGRQRSYRPCGERISQMEARLLAGECMTVW
jgi:hypothetical protein